MILFLLGVLDLLSGISLLLIKYGILAEFGYYFGIYLILKGAIFIKNITSFLDLISGTLLILAANGYYTDFNWIFVLWLLQKSFFTFLSM